MNQEESNNETEEHELCTICFSPITEILDGTEELCTECKKIMYDTMGWT